MFCELYGPANSTSLGYLQLVITSFSLSVKNMPSRIVEYYHHHRVSVMELGHLLNRFGLTYPEVASKVYHDSFSPLMSSVSLPWVIYFEAFYLYVASSFSCIPVICPKLVLFLAPLQFVHLLCNLSKCILLFFSRIAAYYEA